jgi:putative SOS response-associated peptidase YedK
MCGRFVLTSTPAEVAEHFGLEQPPVLTARYNIAPTQLVAVVAPKADPSKRGLALLKWGLVPYWSNDGRENHFNARAETVGGLSTFTDSFRHKRCIVPANGFYEWMVEGRAKVPHRFRLASGGVMGFAGLWSKWEVEGQRPLFSCCIITTAANELVAPFHDRMPAILHPDDYAKWFDHETTLKELHAILKPYPANLMVESAANTLVNSAKNEGPRLLEPAA